MTAVFCDVVGSTPLGEQLDPEVLRRVMGRYFEEMRAAGRAAAKEALDQAPASVTGALEPDTRGLDR